MTLARRTVGNSNRFPARIPDKIEVDEWFSSFTECQTSRGQNRDGSGTMNLPPRRISTSEFVYTRPSRCPVKWDEWSFRVIFYNTYELAYRRVEKKKKRKIYGVSYNHYRVFPYFECIMLHCNFMYGKKILMKLRQRAIYIQEIYYPQ